MDKKMIGMFKSKRFIAYVAAMVIFILGILLTELPALELAGAITLLTGIYIVPQSIRGSKPE